MKMYAVDFFFGSKPSHGNPSTAWLVFIPHDRDIQVKAQEQADFLRKKYNLTSCEVIQITPLKYEVRLN